MPDLTGVNGLRDNFRIVGTPNLPGELSYALAAGVAKFGLDYVIPDMLHAKFLRSPYANAKVLSIDCTKARAIPGVVDVVRWDDEDLQSLNPPPGRTWGTPRAHLDNIADKEGVEVAAIVVAESEDICEEALRALDIEWEVYPHVVDLLDGKKEDAPIIRPGENVQPTMGRGPIDEDSPPKRGNVYSYFITAGDMEAGFNEADHITEYDLYLPPFAAHLPNRIGSVAWWNRDPYQGEGENLHIEGAVREIEKIGRAHV